MGRTKAGPPLAGAYINFPFNFTAGVTNTIYTATCNIPTGMEVTLFGACVNVTGLTDEPDITVLYDSVTTAIVTADATTAGDLGYNALSATVTASGTVQAVVTNDTGDAFDGVHVTVFGYVKEHPTGVGEGRP